MVSAAANLHLPWQKLGLTALAALAYAFFWVNGPLQEPQPVFEFEEHMSGFAEPIRFGDETQTSRFGLTTASLLPHHDSKGANATVVRSHR